jgi:3-oxoacyl-[acyl-carrier-protein] synthase II
LEVSVKINVAKRRSPTIGLNAAITGLGMTTPLGADVASNWKALLCAESGAGFLEEDWASGLPVRIAARVRQEPVEVLDRVAMRRMDRNQQFALIAARQAWDDAGAPRVEPERLAVVIGTGIGGSLSVAAQHDLMLAGGPRRVSPFTVPMLMPNGAAAVVSLELGARAGTHAPTSACASGAEAIAVGFALLRAGRADVVLTGGTEACIAPLSLAAFARLGALSKREHDPQAALRPFDVDRDGFVLGEGAGAIVLERADHARARGARIHAYLAGAGVTSDGYDITAPHYPGQCRALREAMATAGLGPSEVTHINAHATGTVLGDSSEAEAVLDAVGCHPLVTAPKSATGHLIGGSGAVEAIFTTLSVREGIIPPTRNLDIQAPEIKIAVVTGLPILISVEAALSNSFGFGGHNVVLAIVRS